MPTTDPIRAYKRIRIGHQMSEEKNANSTSSASSLKQSQPMEPNTLLASDLLTKSEIALLQQSKKSITDFVQKELPARLKARQQDYMLHKD